MRLEHKVREPAAKEGGKCYEKTELDRRSIGNRVTSDSYLFLSSSFLSSLPFLGSQRELLLRLISRIIIIPASVTTRTYFTFPSKGKAVSNRSLVHDRWTDPIRGGIF